MDPVVLKFYNLNETAMGDMQDSLVFKRLEIESYAMSAA